MNKVKGLINQIQFRVDGIRKMKNISSEADNRNVVELDGTKKYLGDVGELKEEFDENCTKGLTNFSRLIDDTIEYKMHQLAVMDHLGTLIPNPNDHKKIDLQFKQDIENYEL